MIATNPQGATSDSGPAVPGLRFPKLRIDLVPAARYAAVPRAKRLVSQGLLRADGDSDKNRRYIV